MLFSIEGFAFAIADATDALPFSTRLVIELVTLPVQPNI